MFGIDAYRMAFQLNWQPLAIEKQQMLDQRKLLRMAKQQQFVDVYLSCDGFGTKPKRIKKKKGKFNIKIQIFTQSKLI